MATRKKQTNAPHLNDLFLQSLEVDCGKSLDTKSLPNWLKSVTVQRAEIQSPGRDAYRAEVRVSTYKEIADITLSKWVQKSLSNDDSLTGFEPDGNGVKNYIKRYNLNSRVPMGLYRIDITAKDQTSWSSWLVIGDPRAKISVRWQSKDQWSIEKNALLNPHCPLPKQNVTVYDYVDGTYNQVWKDVSDSDYPTSLDSTGIPAGRYILAVSMIHQRWQGPIIVEQSQIISKTYDVSQEE